MAGRLHQTVTRATTVSRWSIAERMRDDHPAGTERTSRPNCPTTRAKIGKSWGYTPISGSGQELSGHGASD